MRYNKRMLFFNQAAQVLQQCCFVFRRLTGWGLLLLLLSLAWLLWQTWSHRSVNDADITLSMSVWGNTEELQTLKALIHDFEAQHSHLHVQIKHTPDFYTQRLQMMMVSQQAPDVMMLNSLDVPRFCQSEVLRDLNTVAGLEPSAYFPSALESLKSPQGVWCALPRDVSNVVIYVNQDFLKELPASAQTHVKPTWTFKDLNTVAHAVATREATRQRQRKVGSPRLADRWTLSFYQAPALFWLPFIWSQGGHAFQQDTFALDAPAVKALNAYKALRQTPAFAPNRHAIGNTSMTDLFLQGRLLFLLSGRWSVPLLRQEATFQWDVLPFPRGRAGSRVGIDATGYGLSAQSRHPKEAEAFLRFLSTASSQARWVRSGLIIPARQSLAMSPVFLQPHLPPKQASVFLDAMATGIPSAYPKQWTSLGQRVNQAMDVYFNTPNLPLADALDHAQLEGGPPHATQASP
jgi:multiple sugar transport system substrate-binding protein